MNVELQSGSLRPVFFAGWACLGLVAVWEIQMRMGDSALALTAGIFLLMSLLLSRYVLGLSFTAGPMLYLALLGLFHLGLVFPWAIGIYDISRIPWFNPHGLSHALALIIYSVLFFQIGLFAAFRGHWSGKACSPKDDGSLKDDKIFLAGVIVFVAGATMFVTGLIQLDPVNFYRITYSEIFRLQAETDPRFFGSGITVAFIGLYLSAAGASQRQLRVAFLCTGLWVSMLFYLGFRGPALIAGLIVYAIALRKGIVFPKWVPWAVAAALLIAVPMESSMREKPLNERSVPASLGDMNVLDGPAEMGTSIRPLVDTADLIGPGSYRFGKTYLVGLEGVLPNLSLRWQPSPSQSIDELPPSHWITAIVEPWAYRNYGGIGFSAVAEPYMNFGTPGVIVFFLVLGFLLGRLERISIRSAYALASWALVLGSLLWTTRNDFSSFFRPAIWGFLCLGLIRYSSRASSMPSLSTWRNENGSSANTAHLTL